MRKSVGANVTNDVAAAAVWIITFAASRIPNFPRSYIIRPKPRIGIIRRPGWGRISLCKSRRSSTAHVASEPFCPGSIKIPEIENISSLLQLRGPLPRHDIKTDGCPNAVISTLMPPWLVRDVFENIWKWAVAFLECFGTIWRNVVSVQAMWNSLFWHNGLITLKRRKAQLSISITARTFLYTFT